MKSLRTIQSYYYPFTQFFIVLIDMIHENAPITNTFVSVPSDMGQLNCASFIAGIIAGILTVRDL